MSSPAVGSVLFPKLRLLGAKLVKGSISNLPINSVDVRPLHNKALDSFSSSMFGRMVLPSNVPDELRNLLKEQSRGEYAKRLLDALRPGVQQALNTHRSDFGLDPKGWSIAAKRRVYATDYTPPEGGHADMVVSLEPLRGASAAVLDLATLRMLAGSFPGQFAYLTPEQFKEIIEGGRAIDGAPINKIEAMWPEIMKNNAQLMMKRAPLEGYHAIGWNSFINGEGHFAQQIGDFGIQSSLFVTTAIHSQDGLVPWTVVFHPEFPDGVICVSVHFGENPVPGGDFVNSAIAPRLFKLVFRRGCRLGDVYREFCNQFGEEQAARLLLDGEVAKAFHDRLWKEDPRLMIDTAVISSLDAGAEVINFMRLFWPKTVSMVSMDDLGKVSTAAEAEGLVGKGVAEAKLREQFGKANAEIIRSGLVPSEATKRMPKLSEFYTRNENRKDRDPWKKPKEPRPFHG